MAYILDKLGPLNPKDLVLRGNIAAIVLILAGGFMLLTNLGVIDISLMELLRTWWPAVLIALFLTPRPHKKVSLPTIDDYYFYSYKRL